MRAIAPQVDAPCRVIAEEQEEYKPVTAAFVTHPAYPIGIGRSHNSMLLAFRPSDEERVRIAAGEDLYLSLLTFGGPMQGVILLVGKDEAAACYGVPVTA